MGSTDLRVLIAMVLGMGIVAHGSANESFSGFPPKDLPSFHYANITNYTESPPSAHNIISHELATELNAKHSANLGCLPRKPDVAMDYLLPMVIGVSIIGACILLIIVMLCVILCTRCQQLGNEGVKHPKNAISKDQENSFVEVDLNP